MKTKFLGCSQVVAAFATVLALSGGAAQAATCNVPSLFPPYPSIQSAVNDPSCNPINVAAGTYPENVTIPMTRSSLILNGAQAGNPVAGRTFAVGESTITGTGLSLPDITIYAANVIIDGFSLQNLNQSTGILIKTTGDNALITNNIIQGIGGVSFADNTQAIYLENGPDGVTVVGNKISVIAGIKTSNGGVFIGDSTSANPSLNILIEGNSISDIVSATKGAYAIHINNGNGVTANSGLQILNNTIDDLVGGGWVHAIALEANTPGVVVNGNAISNLVSPPFTLPPPLPPLVISTAVAVWFEANPSLGTAKVNQNNFNVTVAAYGIAVQNAQIMPIPSAADVDGTCNWWGDSNGPGPVGPSVTGAQVSFNVDFTPWLIAPAPGAACVGGVASTPGKVTGGGQIPGDDPLFSLTGDLLSIPALTASASGPNGKATFGFVVKCCAPTGNLEYQDQQADVRIKAQSFDRLIISSPGKSCPAVPGSKHATMTGMAQVIRSTGTTTEPLTVEVDDCGEPGTADTFGITTTTYSNGPSTLIGGNIQIH
jgi:hypothetical protein